MERGNRTVKQKLLAWQNDHNALPAWSLSLLPISLSICSFVTYSTQKTPFEVLFCHPVISRTWSLPNDSDDDVEDDNAPAAHLSPDTDINCIQWSLDQSDIEQHEGELYDVDASKVEEESSHLECGGMGEANVDSD